MAQARVTTQEELIAALARQDEVIQVLNDIMVSEAFIVDHPLVLGSAAARITGPLQPGSLILLNETDYVTPDPAAAPIVVAEATEEYPVLTQTDDGARVELVLIMYTLTYWGNDEGGPATAL